MKATKTGFSTAGRRVRYFEFANGFGASVFKDDEGTFELMLKRDGKNAECYPVSNNYPKPEMTERQVQAELRRIAAR